MTCRAFLRWLAAGLLLGSMVLVVAFLGAGNFLVAPAQPAVKADLMVALGGDDGARVHGVLEFYRQGLAPRILLSGMAGAYSKTREHNLMWRARYLLDEGVPQQALLYDRGSNNSWDEAANTLRLMQTMKLDRVLVVSDPPHMRRLSWVWGKAFAGSGKSYVLVASDMEDWDAEHWWRTSPNAQYVFAEYIKLGYYFFTY
jgi:uncharacterized SAM-binding protein YcdF (DUF218 family)